jgi:hypothetical protein
MVERRNNEYGNGDENNDKGSQDESVEGRWNQGRRRVYGCVET